MRIRIWQVVMLALAWTLMTGGGRGAELTLREVYNSTLKKARYVDLTHTITPTIPV